MTKVEKLKIIHDQLRRVADRIEETSPEIYDLLEPAYSQASSMLLVGKYDAERLEKFRETLHLLDSVISNIGDHSPDVEIKHSYFWGYLYGIHDTLVFGLLEAEEDTDADT